MHSYQYIQNSNFLTTAHNHNPLQDIGSTLERNYTRKKTYSRKVPDSFKKHSLSPGG